MDYLIGTPNRRKQKRVCIVNLLKLYRRRDEKQFPNSADTVPVNVATVVPENDVGVSIPALSDLKISTPTHTKNEYLKQLQSFLGLASYHRKYIPHFSWLSAALSDLLRKKIQNLNGPKRLNKRSSISSRV